MVMVRWWWWWWWWWGDGACGGKFLLVPAGAGWWPCCLRNRSNVRLPAAAAAAGRERPGAGQLTQPHIYAARRAISTISTLIFTPHSSYSTIPNKSFTFILNITIRMRVNWWHTAWPTDQEYTLLFALYLVCGKPNLPTFVDSLISIF